MGKVRLPTRSAQDGPTRKPASFTDPRPHGRDDKPYGPRAARLELQYKGMYHFGNQVIVSYTVGQAKIPVMSAYELSGDKVVDTHTLNIGKSPRDLLMRVAPMGTAVALVGDKATLDEKDGYTLLRIPAAATPCWR